MFKKIIISFFLLMGSTHATNQILNFSGDWSGLGTYIYDGQVMSCQVMELQFFADSSTFRFKGGQRVCESHSEKFYQVDMSYKEGKVFIGSQVVGTYEGNEMNVSFSMPDPNGGIRHWRMSMRVEGNHLMYEERRLMNDEQTPLISFAGMLVRQ
jgi:hypothetical protein